MDDVNYPTDDTTAVLTRSRNADRSYCCISRLARSHSLIAVVLVADASNFYAVLNAN